MATALRRRQTIVEARLWSRLRNRQLHGYKFRRQHPIQKYVVDFVCIERKLIIELDGRMHVLRAGADKKRDSILKQAGFMTLRIKNTELKESFALCIERILMGLERDILE